MRRAGLGSALGRERMLFNARAAIERYQALQAAARDFIHEALRSSERELLGAEAGAGDREAGA